MRIKHCRHWQCGFDYFSCQGNPTTPHGHTTGSIVILLIVPRTVPDAVPLIRSTPAGLNAQPPTTSLSPSRQKIRLLHQIDSDSSSGIISFVMLLTGLSESAYLELWCSMRHPCATKF